MNILLICSYFGPETSVGVNRVNSFARHWLNKGCTIDVITMPYQEELPHFLLNQKKLTVHQVAPFGASKSKKASIQTYSNDQSTSHVRLKKIFYWLKKNIFANYLDPRLLWWPKAAGIANKICKEKKIDFILTSVPSYTSHSIGRMAKFRNPSVYWVADYRDLWSGNPIFPGTALVRWIEKKHEQFILKQADLLVTINDDLAKDLHQLHRNKKITVIPNGFESSDLLPEKRSMAQHKDYLSIVYTGTVLAGLQNPEPLFQALTHLLKNHLIAKEQIKILFYGNADAILDTECFRYLLQNGQLVLNGRVSRETSVKAQREADLLLFLGARPLQGGADVKGIVSGKIFEYLVSGVEIMAVGVDDTMIVGEMIQLAGVGSIYAEEVEKIKQRLLDLVAHGAKKVKANQEYLAQFDREKQASLLLSLIEKEIIRE